VADAGSSENPSAGQGPVLLDIGGDVGALVVTMPAALVGIEVEINRVDIAGAQLAHRPHVAVVSRPAAAGLVPSLVFGQLVEGRYELYQRPGGPVELTVEVHGGLVTEAVWPGT
jgi:hypothetical protein